MILYSRRPNNSDDVRREPHNETVISHGETLKTMFKFLTARIPARAAAAAGGLALSAIAVHASQPVIRAAEPESHIFVINGCASQHECCTACPVSPPSLTMTCGCGVCVFTEAGASLARVVAPCAS